MLLGSTLAGLAGAALALELGIFQSNLTQGEGFIAVALVYFGAWRPIGVMAGSLLYGMVAAIVLHVEDARDHPARARPTSRRWRPP